MIKQLLNSVIAKYRDLSVSRRSIICLSLRLRQIIDLLASDKSRYFAQPRPIIVKYLEKKPPASALAGFHAGSLSWSNWNIEMLVFVMGGKSEKPEKNRGREQLGRQGVTKVNPYMAVGWNRTQATLVGGERSYHCVNPTSSQLPSHVAIINGLFFAAFSGPKSADSFSETAVDSRAYSQSYKAHVKNNFALPF